MQLYHRIKKYLFLLATFFCIAIGTHSVLLYLYHDAEIVPERGGTFHIGFIGTASNLNPTQYGTDNANDLALSLLYR